MMQGKSFAFRPGRHFTTAGPHPGKPPFAGHMWLCGIRHVDDRKNMVAEIGEMDRHVRIAPADIPDAMRSNAIRSEECDFARCLRSRDVVDTHAGCVLRLLDIQDVRGRPAEIRPDRKSVVWKERRSRWSP